MVPTVPFQSILFNISKKFLSVEAFFKVPYHCIHMHSFVFSCTFFCFHFSEFCDPLGLGGCAPGFAGGQNGLTTYPLGGCLPVGPGGAGGAPGGAVFDPYAPIQKMTTGCVSGIDAADSYLTSGGNGNKTKKVMYDLLDNEEFDREEIPTYEEVARLFPRPGVFRPIVLIGPPGVGRNELKRRLMALESERYKATIPRKIFKFVF